MSSLHKRTLFALRGNKSRTIKQADKGSCIVVQDTKDYLEQGLAFLSDPETYEEIQDVSSLTAQKANDILAKYKAMGQLNNYTVGEHRMDTENLREQRMYFF